MWPIGIVFVYFCKERIIEKIKPSDFRLTSVIF